MFQHPRIDWKVIDQKKLFLTRLKGNPLNFGHVTCEERIDFLNFVIKVNILKFIEHKEYRGMLGRYVILEDFGCTFDREGVDKYQQSLGYSGRHWLSLQKGEFLEFTESMLERNRRRVNQPKTHVIYMDVSDVERHEIYEM